MSPSPVKPRHGVLLTGDIPAVHEGGARPGVFHTDRERAAASYARLREVDGALPGHGDPVRGWSPT
ncbi:hypothetical protein ACFPIJ_54345 [Dactylosporangium cerinum]|uniref:MBL fold metallo-hydrolase n=1 Tax=Dactylosporangium cerinum TaxID=1434730 RepID=A0ABV9WFD7_9ACTN